MNPYILCPELNKLNNYYKNDFYKNDLSSIVIVGSVVTLNSGGPKMTVASIYRGKNVVCTWFDGEYKTWYGVVSMLTVVK